MKRSKIAHTSNKAAAAPSIFSATQNVSEIDRRVAERREYSAHEQIAPFQDVLPAYDAFEQVLCNDLSTSGISFFRTAPLNAGERLIISLSENQPTIYMAATVMHCRPMIVDEKELYRVGCRFDQQIQATKRS